MKANNNGNGDDNSTGEISSTLSPICLSATKGKKKERRVGMFDVELLLY